ncbi:MAG: aryl-sulfate sulfotransferase [bacterium]|nr:aryl-sulfate sulfotransferase [bacterium]
MAFETQHVRVRNIRGVSPFRNAMTHFRNFHKAVLWILSFLITIAAIGDLRAQQTVGLFKNAPGSDESYTLVRAMNSPSTFIIDQYGRELHSWTDSTYAYWGTPYLRENGNLVHMAFTLPPITAHIVEFDWDGNMVWDWQSTDSSFIQHHDIEPLPNGNLLILGRDKRTKSQFAEAGRDTSGVTDSIIYGEKVIEVHPIGASGGVKVWEWTVLDHLIQDFDPLKSNFGIVENHPELVDVNFGPREASWLHGNSVEYSAKYDQVILSLRNLNELWVLDHTTTSVESSGHTGGDRGMGGDILYRWGNPQSYRAGDSTNQQFSWQHHAQIIGEGLPGAGNLIAFNNGNLWLYSSIVEIESPADALGNFPIPSPGTAHTPTSSTWTYTDTPPSNFYAYFISSCQRLANGNTFMCQGPLGEFREVNAAGDIVWKYQNPIGRFGATVQGEPFVGTSCFRAFRYAPDYPAFDGRSLIPTHSLEVYPTTISGSKTVPMIPSEIDQVKITANITASAGLASATALVDTGDGMFPIMMTDDGTNGDEVAMDSWFTATLPQVTPLTSVSYYIETVDDTAATVNDPPNPPETVYRFVIGYACGNIDGLVEAGNPTDISDLTYLVDFLFAGGAAPIGMDAANVDGQSSGGLPVDIGDLTYLVDFLFQGGLFPSCQ